MQKVFTYSGFRDIIVRKSLCNIAIVNLKYHYMNNYTGVDYTSPIPIDFDCYNPHPYQRTTGFIKSFQLTCFLHHVKNHTRTKYGCMQTCIINFAFT